MCYGREGEFSCSISRRESYLSDIKVKTVLTLLIRCLTTRSHKFNSVLKIGEDSVWMMKIKSWTADSIFISILFYVFCPPSPAVRAGDWRSPTTNIFYIMNHFDGMASVWWIENVVIVHTQCQWIKPIICWSLQITMAEQSGLNTESNLTSSKNYFH